MKQPRIDIISLFPNFFLSPLKESLLARAVEKGLLQIKTHNLRDFSTLPHQSVDDSPYGGGAGMVLRADVLAKSVLSLKKRGSLVVLLDPSGKKFEQELAAKLSLQSHLILVCGRYEGIDQRFKDKFVDLELSIGDYILNGGEAAALVILETVARLIPGMVGKTASLREESFSPENKGLLEYPQYTRPEVFEGQEVPKVLLSGNHQEIAQWRKRSSLEKTKKLRPDLLKN